MHIIHGTWIPDSTHDFIQSGAFYLWVETDTLDELLLQADAIHPRHLMQPALSAFLTEKVGMRKLTTEALESAFCAKYFLLPTSKGKPAPSFELLRYVDEEEPVEFELQPWQVNCYRISDIITILNDIHFTALYAAEDFQLGADLLFWYEYAQMFKGIITRDQYIPALTYRVVPSTTFESKQDVPSKTIKSKQRTASAVTKSQPVKDTAHFEIHPTWELLSDTYETAVQSYAAAMPTVCTAGLNTPDKTTLFTNESLLRHFSEVLLHTTIIETPFTAKFDQQVAGTILYRCIHPDMRQDVVDLLTDYKYWLAWRKKFSREHVEAGFTLCFQLDEARADDIDNWQLHFLVAARNDPSFKLSLDQYWQLTSQQRVEASHLFGQEFEKNLLLTLGYAARIYPKIWSGLATEQPVGCRLTLDEAFSFLKENSWVLSDANYLVIVPAWWTSKGRRRTKVRLKTSSRTTKRGTADVASGRLSLKSIISYQYQLSVGGQEVTQEEWLQLVNAKTPLVQFRGQWIELDRDKMQEMLQFWQTHQEKETEVTMLDMLKIEVENEDELEWEHDQYLNDMLSRLHDKDSFAPIGDLPGLQGNLRDYQKRGVAWLQYLENLGLNPCLADDMGLGKTLEVIACLVKERDSMDGGERVLPTLVIAPTSVLGNWRKEIERFAPHIRTLVHQGSARRKDVEIFAEACQEHDVVLTSFALARLDEKILQGIEWHRVVVDEAQNIKNPQAAQTRAIMKIRAPHKLALTGTPVENRLRDLWSIFNFLNPGYLGKEAQFRKTFELPIYRNNDVNKLSTLKKLVEPFILRRVKTDKRIIDDLPDKIEQKMYCTLTPEQASLYEAVVKDVAEQLKEADGMQRRGLILSTILKLKQICNHPAQFLQDGSAFTSERSHKFQRLTEMIEEVIASGESALIFTQFTTIGDALSHYLEHTKHYNTYYLHGGTNAAKRERMVTEFQDQATEPSLFILSLRAGGVGINLTKANHVFHFDRWWNPSVEDQATDRAFRIGQRKNVFVHKFVAVGTMEERIDAMIEDKKRMSSLVVGSDEAWLTELDNDTFKDLIALRRSSVME